MSDLSFHQSAMAYFTSVREEIKAVIYTYFLLGCWVYAHNAIVLLQKHFIQEHKYTQLECSMISTQF